jgi:hypothetical protein
MVKDLEVISVECPKCGATMWARVIREDPWVWQGICKGCRRYEKFGIKRLTAREADILRGRTGS